MAESSGEPKQVFEARLVKKSANSLDNTVSQIEELAGSLIDTVEFTEDLQESFQLLAKSLVELESERTQLHDELEVQTINASVKRHMLKNIPEHYQKHLEAAVIAARDGNASTIESLRSQMNITTEATRATLMRQQVLQTENAKYLPERDIVTRQHDELIAALNQRMADKATKQIKYNETNDQLREVTSSIKEFDFGMKNLEEDMKAFLDESNSEQAQLESEIIKTQDAIRQQKEKNAEVKSATDEVLDKIVEMNTRLDVVLKDVRRTENSKTRLEIQSIQLQENINREKIINQETAEEVEMLESVKERRNMEYQEKIQQLESKVEKVLAEYRSVDETHQALSKEKDEVFLKKEETHRNKSKAQASVRERGREVQVVKRRTTDLIEKSAKITQENGQYHEDMQTLEENHTATVETFNQQITDFQANLDLETTEKKKVQEEQEHTEKVLDDFRGDQVRFMNDMTKKIEDGRHEHKLLVQEKAKYSRGVAANLSRSNELQVELDVAKKSREIMRAEITMEIERLKTSIELCQAENTKKKKYIEELIPKVKALDTDLEVIDVTYGQLKNEVVAVRNRQKSAQEQINRTQGLVDKLDKPYRKLKEDLKSCRINQLVQISESAQAIKKQDSEIYDFTCKMENLGEENVRFVESCIEKEQTIAELLKDIKAHGSYQSSLIEKLSQLQKSFIEAWKVCVAMEIESADSDARLLDNIQALQQETKDRCVILTTISKSLIAEMEMLTSFLNNVNSRRPKDTRQERRVSMKPTPPPDKPSLVTKTRKKSFNPKPRKSIGLAPATPSKQTITA